MQPLARIPSQFREPLQELAELPEGEAGELLGVVEGADTFQTVQGLLETVRSAFPDDRREKADRLVQVLLSLSAQYRPKPRGEVARAVSESATMELSADARERLRVRLAALLEAEAIRTTASAVELLTEHDKNYDTARIITDIRPVFPGDVSQQPTGAVLVEVLQLRVWDRTGDAETIYVAMDEADLVELKEVVERALTKTQTLRDFLRRHDVKYFELDKREK